MKKLRPVLGGLKTYIPYLSHDKGTGGTNSARYCYSVWLRHLYVAFENGLKSYPETIAELGPGDSIGIGCSGLIGGARHYYGLDVVKHLDIETNQAIFKELVGFFKNRENIPDDKEFPRVYPRLDSYNFMDEVFSEDALSKAMNVNRIEAIRKELRDFDNDKNSYIRYICPWINPDVICHESVDMIFSQAVLEHISDLDNTYKALYRWLKKDGIMSHQIGFSSHGITESWNGHWEYSELLWKVIQGNRPYLINREPLSTHIKYHELNGFEVICIIPIKNSTGLTRKKLAKCYKDMSDEDLNTICVHIISKKK